MSDIQPTINTTDKTYTFQSEADFKTWATGRADDITDVNNVKTYHHREGDNITLYKIVIALPDAKDTAGALDAFSNMSDIFALMALLMTTFKEIRKAGYESRAAEQNMRMTEIKNSAQKMRDAAQTGLVFAVVTGGLTLAASVCSISSTLKHTNISNKMNADLGLSKAQQQVDKLNQLQPKTAELNQLKAELRDLSSAQPPNTDLIAAKQAEIDAKQLEIKGLKDSIGEIKREDGSPLDLDNLDDIKTAQNMAKQNLVAEAKKQGSYLDGDEAKAAKDLSEAQDRCDNLNSLRTKNTNLSAKQATLEAKKQELTAAEGATPPDATEISALKDEIGKLNKEIKAIESDRNTLIKKIGIVNDQNGNSLKLDRALDDTLDDVQSAVDKQLKTATENMKLNFSNKDIDSLQRDYDRALTEAGAAKTQWDATNQGVQAGSSMAGGLGQFFQANDKATQQEYEALAAKHQAAADTSTEEINAMQEVLRSIVEKLKAMMEAENQALSHVSRV